MNKEIIKAINSGIYPTAKNKVWTMCQCALEMCTLAMEEAEKNNLTGDQFFLHWEDCLNLISVKDHNNNDISEFGEQLKSFYDASRD